MKNFIKYLYYFVTMAMFVVFINFLSLRLSQFNSGAYAYVPIEKEQCENINGFLVVVDGADRCYTNPGEYKSGEDFGNALLGGPKTYKDCVISRGKLVSEEGLERCYFNKTLFFDKAQDQNLHEKDLTHEGLAEANKKNPEEDSKIDHAVVSSPTTDFLSCKKNRGKIVEIPFNRLCYISSSKFFSEKKESEVIESLKNYSECKEYGGEIVSVPLNSRCYLSPTRFFSEKTEKEILDSIGSYSKCKEYRGEIIKNRCYLNKTKYFKK